ncbi:MAG: recombinase family protein [Candidatus Sulfotelmatobacter sp.]
METPPVRLEESATTTPSSSRVFGPTKNVALYARVSTTLGQDPDMQLRELRIFAQARGWEIAGVYVDRGISGSKDRRPQLDLLMSAAHTRQFDVLLVWKLDRFARSLKHLVTAIAEFEALSIQFVSLRDNLDLTTPSGRLMFHVIGAMAEFERSLIQERVRAGLRNAVAKGKRLGRPRIAVPTAKVQRLRREGLSWSKVAKTTKLSKTTLMRICG